jgi:hypothetical protein
MDMFFCFEPNDLSRARMGLLGGVSSLFFLMVPLSGAQAQEPLSDGAAAVVDSGDDAAGNESLRARV